MIASRALQPRSKSTPWEPDPLLEPLLSTQDKHIGGILFLPLAIQVVGKVLKALPLKRDVLVFSGVAFFLTQVPKFLGYPWVMAWTSSLAHWPQMPFTCHSQKHTHWLSVLEVLMPGMMGTEIYCPNPPPSMDLLPSA